MIERQILKDAKYSLTQFRAMCVTGPRQSGKTTISKMLFKGKPYLSFENPLLQNEADDNIENFMKKYAKGAIFDEVQRVPNVFRQLQGMLDTNSKRGQFILTGSNNFLLQEQISQSLAGRAGYLELLPLSYAELQKAKLATSNVNHHILMGGYPEIWNEKLNPTKWMNAYVQTYLQRDVRLLRNITNFAAFNRFIYLCANYAGQLLNKDELAKTVGVDAKTIQAWLGVLESSYIIYLLQPWHNNLNKRIVKSPKLYFYDTGLLCYLLGITNQLNLIKHARYGAIFENWNITEIKKNRTNEGVNGGMFFFRDSAGNEIDLLLEKNSDLIGIEIKSAKKLDSKDFQGLKYWKKYNQNATVMLLYGGTKNEILNNDIGLVSWREIANI
ncbi:MAG: ATP-binding protein [Ferruginibacter sp.]|nr:ATP-binding protein [Ferruginibacter sp.]